ncbi:MAG: VOC family protein [Pseudomonadota bacterium]
MARIDLLTLRVTAPAHQTQFYRDVLGMKERGDDCVGYADAEARLRFVQADAPYASQKSDLYWKIALSVPNIELAYEQLRKAGVDCSEPHQFEDVGYLAHFTDPEGFTIELIDHAFKGDRTPFALDETRLGGGAHLSLVTLRTAEIDEVEPTLLGWGMRKLSVQHLTAYGFTLHFYAFTDEAPPNADLASVENRTWVYQRPYTVLELQHIHRLSEERRPPQSEGGYDRLTFTAQKPLSPLRRLNIDWSQR